MRYFAPERSAGLSGLGCYLRPDGRPIAALPSLSLRPVPSPDGETRWWEVTVHLLVGFVTARPYTITIRQDELDGLLTSWLEDPERVLKEHFRYVPFELPAQVRGKPVVSLEDLGL